MSISGRGRSWAAAPSRVGFTLIELLAVIAIIGVAIALLLPAVQSAREASRRVACAANLRQIGIALQAYHDVHGGFPPGQMLTGDPRYIDSALPCRFQITDKSFLVAILPHVQQGPLYNAFNHSLYAFALENRTGFPQLIATYLCPSDALAFRTVLCPPLERIPGQPPSAPLPMALASYGGCHGSNLGNALPQHDLGCRVSPEKASQANGVITDVAPVTLESIRDGTSTTLAVVEKATASLRGPEVYRSHYGAARGWWFSGHWVDTVITTYYAPNAHRAPNPVSFEDQFHAASSFHPGGVNALMADGSARFIKETVSSRSPWASGTRGGVWQALGTRAGGEAIGADDF